MSLPIPILAGLILVGSVLGFLYLMGLTKRWGILIPFCGMLLFSGMATPIEWNDQVVQTFWLPVQQVRSQFFLAAGVVGTLSVLLNLNRILGKGQSSTAWVLITAGFYGALLRFAHEDASSGSMSAVFRLVTMLPLALAPAIVMQKIDDIFLIFRWIFLVNIGWLGMSVIQFLNNPSDVTMGREQRFVGILGNAQHAGVLMAFFLVVGLWLLLNDGKRYWLVYFGVVGINALLMLWTGSRTALGMGLIGVSAVLYSRAGRAILLVPFAGISSYIGIKVLVNVMGISLGLERLASTQNTRSNAWADLFATGMDNLFVGIGTDGATYSENSWLYGFASYGVGMLLLLVLALILGLFEMLKMTQYRFRVGRDERPIFDVLIGIMAMYFAGAVLEGYMISRVSAPMCFFLLACGMGAAIRRFVVNGEFSSDEYEEEWHDDGSVYDGYEDYGEDAQLQSGY